MSPSCLRVDRATIFFRSISFMALSPARNMVRVPTTKSTAEVEVPGKRDESRNMRYTPAVTRVEEWTKALTGVGAAIAAGSHAENGT